MQSVTYIITVYNKEKYITNVINSLKRIKGDFEKEFIIIDDGSTDNSLNLILQTTKNFANTMIFSQKNQGPTAAINKGISLAHGNFVHFIDGDDIVSEDSTLTMLNACYKENALVSYGLRGSYDPKTLKTKNNRRSSNKGYKVDIINDPMKYIIQGKTSAIRGIGGASRSVVYTDLLKKIYPLDKTIFVQDMLLSLECSRFSHFAFVDKTVSYVPTDFDSSNLSFNSKKEKYNTLCAIYQFINRFHDVAEKYPLEIYNTLISNIWKINKTPKNAWRYVLSKCTRNILPFDQLIDMYRKELNILALKDNF